MRSAGTAGHDALVIIQQAPGTDPPLPVGAVMTPFPMVVRVDTSLNEIAELLAANDISGLPVVDASGVLVGVVSHSDLIRAAVSSGHGPRLWSGYTARHVMSRHPVIAHPDTPLVEAARRLERNGIHRLVIVAADETRPVGVLSVGDLLPVLVDASEALGALPDRPRRRL
jgi:CBS domain-containing protein